MNKAAFLREVKQIEFINRNLWRFIRPLVKHQLARRCQRCVIPETYRGIEADGLCAACRQLQSEPANVDPSDEQEGDRLNQILREHSFRTQGVHNALVLISGGKDSSPCG